MQGPASEGPAGRAGARERRHARARYVQHILADSRHGSEAAKLGTIAIGFLYRVEMMSVWTPWGRMFPGARVVR